jgi:molybdate transport system ATP-binding protein
VVLATAQPVRDGLCAIGIRARHYSPNISENRFPAVFTNEIETPFEFDCEFRYAGQSADSDAVRCLFAKEKRTEEKPAALVVAAEHVMLLYG